MKVLATCAAILLMSFSVLTSTIHVGEKAPEIVLSNPQGDEIKLSDLQGNIVLIDFWASWCGPCRALRPKIVDLHETFGNTTFENGMGFEVFSVSLDKNKEAWEKAISTEKMIWNNHGSELKGWQSNIVKSYNIKGIPANVLINEKGEVLGKNMTPEQIKKTLNGLKK